MLSCLDLMDPQPPNFRRFTPRDAIICGDKRKFTLTRDNFLGLLTLSSSKLIIFQLYMFKILFLRYLSGYIFSLRLLFLLQIFRSSVLSIIYSRVPKLCFAYFLSINVVFNFHAMKCRKNKINLKLIY